MAITGPKRIQVCLSPALLPYYHLDDTVAVVIDIFRATSSMCYGLANGAKAIIPVAEVEECLAYREHGYLLAAERNGEVVKGFDFGNSPFSYTRDRVEGKTIVLTTTNGTRAIRHCAGATAVAIGSFLNIGALSNWLNKQNRHILLVCAGWKNHVNLEDTVFAGGVISRISHDDIEMDDSAQVALAMFRQAQGDLAGFLSRASHAKRMQHLHIEQDIAFCLQTDTIAVVPVLQNDALVCLNEDQYVSLP